MSKREVFRRGARRATGALGEFLYGMTGYEFARHGVEMRGALETLFMTAAVGDMIGVPVLPPYYALRLLPYMVPDIAIWKRRVLRERAFTDGHDHDLHGI